MACVCANHVTARQANIYTEFLQGATPHTIAASLTADGILPPGGKERWNPKTVQSILQNEKYKGDALLQKCFTEDFLTKRQVKNQGQVPQYYVTGDHEAIIPEDVFDMVQREIAMRKPGLNRHSGVRVFSSTIYCGECGGVYGSKVCIPTISIAGWSGDATGNTMAISPAVLRILMKKR